MTKKGKKIKRLRAVPVNANIQYVLRFIDSFLSNIIHHRSLLRNYRTNIGTVLLNIDDLIELWLDFLENFTHLVKDEIQSLHWSKEQVTMHSGITKQNGINKYHPCLSDDKNHDQCFVFNTLDEISTLKEQSKIVIITDNRASQYKSAQNFHDLQKIAQKTKSRIIKIYGIPCPMVRTR